MKRNMAIRVVTMVLALVMVLGCVPATAFASIPNWEENNVVYDGNTFGTNGYYNVISKKDYVLVPGAAVESEIVLNNASGSRRQVIHVIEVDPSNPDVSVIPGYHQLDKIVEDRYDEANWSHKELTDMAAYYEDSMGYNIVGGMNTDLYYDSYAPRILVYNGQNLGVHKPKSSQSVLYVFQDAEGNISCEVAPYKQAEFDSYMEQGILLHAVGILFDMVVKDGKLVNTKVGRSGGAARSMIGVKEDGTLVLCMNDGRNANNSVGFSDYEEGEAMLALGCKWAANCDGGGSSTFLSKRVGEEDFVMRSTPCDGAQRPTAHGIFVVSNVAPTGILNNVNVTAEYDIFAPNTTYTFSAEAIDTHGYAMEMPADAAWGLSDAAFGSIENGTFISNGTKGTVDIQVLSGGAVVGTKTITVADPEVFELSAASTTIPYSTEEKVRTITLPIVAMTGESNVFVDANAVSVALSNEAAGELDGFCFTATADTSISGVDVTVTYGSITLVYTITFGKGSEVIYDFEDGDRAGFMGFEEAKQWSIDNGIANTIVGSDPLAGQMNSQSSSETYTVTAADGGQVRNGEYALAWRLDNTDADFSNWTYNVLFNTGETIVLRDVANGKLATSLGMWLYIPEEAFPAKGGKGLAFQSQFYIKNADGSYTCKQDHFTFTSAATGKQTNLNSATNADIPESRWVYASIDISKYDFLCTPIATMEGNSRTPSFIRTYVQPIEANQVTFYIDDITLDYSSAVDDRVLPEITAPAYSTADTAAVLENGVTVPAGNFAFSATVTDNTALDLTSGKIFVDGIQVKSAISGSVLSSKEDAVLASGMHTVTFEVKDELGNPRRLTRTFTVSGEAAVVLSGHNESGKTPKAQSVYYVDINVADLTAVESVSAVLKLNNCNTWETEGAVVADGFAAAFDYNEVSELLTVTVELEDAANVKSDGQALVSIPVRVWTFDRFNYVTETYVPAADMGNKPVVNINCQVVSGLIDGASFGGSISVATELTTISSPYHIHDAELTVLSQEPTLTSSGFEGRTYCESCQSVVDWGTILEKLDHNYQISGNKFVCVDEGCGEVYESGTGIFRMNGDLYYSINGELKTGWQTAESGYCYAGSDYKLYVGEKFVNGVAYIFDENGCTAGAWFSDDNGTCYSYGPRCYARMWVEIDGKTYYFGSDCYMYTGIRFVKDSPATPAYWYDFGEDGAVDKSFVIPYGLYEVNGDHYIVKDGETQSGVHLIDGAYYYGGVGDGFGQFGCIAKNMTMSVTSASANGLIPSGSYTFGDDGKMVINHGPVNGFFYDENGFMVHAYQLVEFEGDYYFISDYHRYVVNKKVYLSEAMLAGTSFKPGYFEFGADGKMIVANGPMADGSFYLNGVRQYAYQLVEFQGDYYFIGDYHKYAVNKQIYLTEAMLVGTSFRPGYFEFGADGKMIVVNGPMADGSFYLNGVRQYAYQLVEFQGDYYFIGDYHKYAVNKQIYLTEAMLVGTSFRPGYFEFGADGKMIVANGPMADGSFYLSGVRQYAYQLVEFQGDYYFISDYHRYIVNKQVYLTEAMLEGTSFKPGYFEFGADGKMMIANGPMADGYFYLNGVKQYAYQLVEFQGDYYFIGDYHRYTVNKKVYLTEAMLEGTSLKPGYFEFGADGKMIIVNGPMADGYFYLNGVKQLAYQLIAFEGDYYFIGDYHRYAVNKQVYLTEARLEGTGLKAGYYEFGADGKMIIP